MILRYVLNTGGGNVEYVQILSTLECAITYTIDPSQFNK